MNNATTKSANQSGEAHADWKLRGMFPTALAYYLRHAPEHPGKLRMFHWLRRLATPKAWLAEYRASGTLLSVDAGEYIGWSIITRGSFEPASLSLALRIMDRYGGWFADIGAHHGLYTCVISSRSAAQVLSFEPNPESFLKLAANVRSNNRTNVELIHAAAAATPVLLPWKHTGDGSGSSAWSKALRPGEASDYRIAAVRFADVVEGLGWGPPTLAKIDVEGGEWAALQGFDFQAIRPRFVLVEAGATWAQTCELLSSAGYKRRDDDLADLGGGGENVVREGNFLFVDASAADASRK